MTNFILCSPSSSGLSLALAQHLFKTTTIPLLLTTRHPCPSSLQSTFLAPFSNGPASQNLNPSRLHFTHLDFTKEPTIKEASDSLPTLLNTPNPLLRWAWVTPGLLYPERSPYDLDLRKVRETFDVNVIGHLLMIKHFSKYLPRPSSSPLTITQAMGLPDSGRAVWVNMSARIGSISDNQLGGWYSYRASKAALNQITKTFDVYLKQRGGKAMCVGMHPGTVETGLGRGEFWEGVRRQGKVVMGREEAAEKVVGVVRGLKGEQSGRCWDWKGQEVPP
ncbi:hypothetical protein EV426DRAFT_335159 [Tirmania nivea]|nr:hypothetical protein EV426DRAFT_335159 [Tirmania nivea]